ncbi:uncharacterized protein B0I36DRAFT_412707 [Microdochium trichocladiopsis]|uniref:BTB domain-containing protein n=1 Tax=Microdochium trichocladiopsis TaxID=1682393 RepID=A0A9P8Y1P3_9PEZI|nr:uncharacterized protein B0I36DRAFT_412707 [Microdochium trichocladiopsis]KAH7027273.1 hypothetical protein B0I36DRAFT_412707 [Microdochium trichocladiopsis]
MGSTNIFVRRPEPAIQTIDKRGDLWLLVGEDISSDEHPAANFQVCSRTLARCSPVFDRMLFGGFVESKKTGSMAGQDAWTIDLPEDEPTYVKHLLDLIHGNLNTLGPQNQSDEERIRFLYGVVWVADKYAALPAIRSYVAYEAILTILLKKVSKTNDDGHSQFILHEILPIHLQDTIGEAHEQALEELLRPTKTALGMLSARIQQGVTASNAQPRNKTKSKKAGYAARQNPELVELLREEDLWPLPEATTTTLSPEDLALRLHNIAKKLDGILNRAELPSRAKSQWFDAFFFSYHHLSKYVYKATPQEINFMNTQRNRLGMSGSGSGSWKKWAYPA